MAMNEEERLKLARAITDTLPAPEEIRDDVDFLRANVYLAMARPADAVDVLEDLKNAEDLNGFSRYNLRPSTSPAGSARAGR